VGVTSLLFGFNKGHEYAELPEFVCWPILLLMVWNLSILVSTIAARREPKMYVSLWYIGGTIVWIPIMFAVGNVMWHPFNTVLADGQIQHAGAVFGLNDAVWNWFYGHNVFGLYITTGGIAIAYYLVPKITKRPLYSHTLSLIGFWTIALFYAPTGQHHLLQVPIPNWLKILAVIGSIALFVPVFTFNTNIFMTMRGAWGMMLTNIPLRFLITGAFFYLAVSAQGSIQSLITVNRFIHYTQWTVAHAHLALLGAFGFIASGAMLWMVPQILRKPLWSRNLADAQFWLMLLGINGFFWALTAAGLAQASAWVSLGQQVVRAYPVVKPYFYLRTIFGGMIWVGAFMMMINLFATWLRPAPDENQRRMEMIAEIEETQAAVGT
jgi:cbb3-type cytochrome c oxidase subunit I